MKANAIVAAIAARETKKIEVAAKLGKEQLVMVSMMAGQRLMASVDTIVALSEADDVAFSADDSE